MSAASAAPACQTGRMSSPRNCSERLGPALQQLRPVQAVKAPQQPALPQTLTCASPTTGCHTRCAVFWQLYTSVFGGGGLLMRERLTLSCCEKVP